MQFLRISLIRVFVVLASFLSWQANAAESNSPVHPDFSVTAGTKDMNHPHFGEGGMLGFIINGVQGRSLVLVRGKTYQFSVDTGPMHDFYLSTDSLGWGTAPLLAGVKGNFTYHGTLIFTPTAETPNLIYYACRNHKLMGGEIHIVNPGEEDKIKIVVSHAASAVEANRPPLDKHEVQQRLNFVNMFVTTSAAAERIKASRNEEAKAKYKIAEDRLAEAVSAFDSDLLHEAKSKFDEAMMLMNQAAKLVPSESMLRQLKSKYEELVKGIADMEVSYKQNLASLSGMGETKNFSRIDLEKLHKSNENAKALMGEGKYEEANKILGSSMNEISAALNKLLANRTMAYEMKFETVSQEYEYEQERFASLDKLIPQAIEQKQPSPSVLSLTESFLNKAKDKRKQAIQDAEKRNFSPALESIKEAVKLLETALKLLGVN